jgi:hypothetical protein
VGVFHRRLQQGARAGVQNMRACERGDGMRLVRDTDVYIGSVFVLYIDDFVSFAAKRREQYADALAPAKFRAQSDERVLWHR